MPDEKEELKVNMYRYILSDFDILFPNKTVKVEPRFISSISIKKRFDENVFPIFKVSVNLKTRVYYELIKRKDEVKFRVRLQKFYRNLYEEDSIKKDEINDVFISFIEEDTPFFDEKLFDKKVEVEGEENTPENMSNNIDLFLFKENDINATSKVLNTVLTSANMTSAVSYVLSEAGFKKMLISPFHNSAFYKELVIIPATALGIIKHLENQYGLYNSKAILFMDIDRGYLINKSKNCIVYEKAEIKETHITIKEPSDDKNYSSSCKEDLVDKKYYINLCDRQISIKNLSISNDPIEGNNSIFVNRTGGSKVRPGSFQRGSGTYKVRMNITDNKYLEKVEEYEQSENNVVLTINIEDFDIKAFRPNKQFTFKFENPKISSNYSGNYRLIGIDIFLNKQGEEFFISGKAVFKK